MINRLRVSCCIRRAQLASLVMVFSLTLHNVPCHGLLFCAVCPMNSYRSAELGAQCKMEMEQCVDEVLSLQRHGDENNKK